MDEPINFVYEDSDSFQNEISELYSYSEESEFFSNRNAFEESMEDCGLPLTWKHMVPEQKSRAINYLMTTLELSSRTTRMKSCRALAYMIQGNFGECLSLEEQATNSQQNVFLLFEQGIFQAFVQQLLIEANKHSDEPNVTTSSSSLSMSSSSQTFNDSSELRLLLSVLFTITEIMFQAKDSTDTRILELRQQFINDLQNPFGDELLSITLFKMLNTFCCGLAPHYPIRKITLLLWKIILITLGGTQTMRQLKDLNRKIANLDPMLDDTLEVTKNMRPCSPPLMPDGQARARTALSGSFANKRKVFKQPAFDDAVFAYAKECLINSLAELNQPDMENEQSDAYGEFSNELNDSAENAIRDSNNENDDDLYHLEGTSDSQAIDKSETEDAVPNCEDTENKEDPSSEETVVETIISDTDNMSITNPEKNDEDQLACAQEAVDETDFPRESSESDNMNNLAPPLLHLDKPQLVETQLDGSHSDVTATYKGLPWVPKVRKSELNQHMAILRQKFMGYTLNNEFKTLFGFPDPIVEGIDVLKKHMYISLSEVQLEKEEEILKYPLTHKEINPNYRDTPAEKLYSALLPRLPQYMIALLKILLAASTSSKNKSERAESINIMCEVNSDCGAVSIIQTMRMNADANRHKEVIIKAVSAILILLLKHLKVNHIYQFEYVSQQLMFANCIPLILKFLSQDIHTYIVTSKSTISAIDFPACVIGEQPELTAETIQLSSFQPYCWRNMFSCINLVRILNKLTKWKHSRIMMLVVFKSAPTLAKALNVRHSMFQLYILKLLKVQLKFLGRQWKKTNMKLISAIYQKVRHRLTDDWAYSNDNEARPWDFQAEEFTLQANINKFHQRRYQNLLTPMSNGRGNQISTMGNDQEKFIAFDDCTDEDYDFGINDMSQISPHFEKSYERWLENEVFQRNIDWDKLLND